MSDFKDKAVIVTGGAKGIGRAICLAFAREGASVLCADVDEKAGVQLAGVSGELAGTIRFQRADVAQSGECQALVEAAVSEWGGVDVLCNNVGIQPVDSYLPAHELPEETWDRIIDVNLQELLPDDKVLRAGDEKTRWRGDYQHGQCPGTTVDEGGLGLCSQQRWNPLLDPPVSPGIR